MNKKSQSQQIGPTQKITPFLWFDHQSEEAVDFYLSVFENSGIKTISRYGKSAAKASGQPEGTVMTISFFLENYEFVAINGGPVFNLTPTISFFVYCNTAKEVDHLWEKLSKEGTVFMPLETYPFSPKYGWIQDKYGVSWQIILHEFKQKIVPCFMFSGKQHLKAEEAIRFYTSVFPDSAIHLLERYQGGVGPEGAIVHGKFTLCGEEFLAMDSHEPIPFDFNPGISLVVNCNNQNEIDRFWDSLTEGGNPGAQACGWLSDKFGVSWQIVPSLWAEWASSDPVKADKIMNEIVQMSKIDLLKLEKAIS